MQAGVAVMLVILAIGAAAAGAGEPVAEPAAVKTVRLELPVDAGPVVRHLATVFARQVASRCDATVATEGETPLVVTLAAAAEIGAEGYRIEDRPGGGVRILGPDDRGLVAGVGKFLRTSRYDRGGFTPGTWRGESVPQKPDRGIYFATHFHNWYHAAPIPEIERYVEDLALWGTNALLVWYDMHHFDGFDDPTAVAFRGRLRAILEAARRMGMDVSLVVIGNEAYANSPVELRAAGRGRGGWYPCAVCPSKPEGMEYILKVLGEEFDWAADLKPRSIWIWPYDQGGCECAECKPWGSRGFMKCVVEVGRLARHKLPGTKIAIATWMMDNNEWSGVRERLAAESDLVDAIVHEPGHCPAIDPQTLRVPILGFPEISMHDTWPWGGFGATPLTARAETQWKAVRDRWNGGYPYSEGLYEDITKAAYSQLYWSDRPVAETVKEYAAFEFSPDVADDVADVVNTLERNHHVRWWPGLHDGVPLTISGLPTKGAKPRADPGAEEAFATMQAVDARLTPQARASWRWRLLYLRALLDARLKANGGSPDDACNAAFAELFEIYHADNAISDLRPPVPQKVPATTSR